MILDSVTEISIGVIRLPHGKARHIITSLNELSNSLNHIIIRCIMITLLPKKRSLTFINNEDDVFSESN